MSKGLEELKEIRLTINILIRVLEDIFAANDVPIKDTVKNAKHALKQIPKIEEELKGYERMLKVFGMKELANTERKLKALEIIKVLFKGRARLYERNDGVEQIIDKNGNYHKANCVVYILGFHVEGQHCEFHLHREEYDLLKEVLLWN